MAYWQDMPDSAPPNALADADSPYLRQHAGNPVAWQPWGEAAFAEARRRNVPVFLSIGYSTCHWCHVMAHESFENPEIAAFLNEHFVSVKVDREERPDVDLTYMTYVQAATGHGGWPMTVFLTPQGLPFFGGTYFPPEDRHGRTGFPGLLRRIQELWQAHPGDLEESARSALAQLRQANASPGGKAAETPDAESLATAAVRVFSRQFDTACAGFGNAPNSPGRPRPRSCSKRRGAGRIRHSGKTRSPWCPRRFRRWPTAGSMINWAAGSTVMPSIASGTSRITKRCSMIRRRSRHCIWSTRA